MQPTYIERPVLYIAYTVLKTHCVSFKTDNMHAPCSYHLTLSRYVWL